MSNSLERDGFAPAPCRADRPGRRRSAAGIGACLLGWLLLALVAAPSALAQCAGSARTTMPATVYDRPPAFSTGAGWQYGGALMTLPANSEVRVCESAAIGLFADKKKWLRIDLGGGRSGWIFAGGTTLAAARPPARSGAGFSLVSSAMAAEAAVPNGLPGFGERKMILVALLCVLLGMLGKLVFDEAEASPTFSWRECLQTRKYIKAFVAAPLALVAFLNLGNFSFSNEVAVVVSWCMAFQNGFFWQTLLPAAKREAAP